MHRTGLLMVSAMALSVALTAATVAQSPPAQQPPPAQPPPVPRPFPGSAPPATTRTSEPATPAAATPDPVADAQPAVPAPPGTPPEVLRVPIHPSAEYLESFDAGRGQRYYLFGVNSPYTTIVEYYKTVMRNGGRELVKAPGMQQFDLGRFQEETMAYPPSVVVKDYAWGESTGYLFVSGTTQKRYRTIIQIVPPAGPIK